MLTRHTLMPTLAAGIIGIVIGRSLPRSTPPSGMVASTAPTPPVAAPAHQECKSELSSAKAQLAICLAYRALPSGPDPTPPGPRAPEPAPMASTVPEPGDVAISENRRRLDSYSEAVIVMRTDGTT